MLEQFLNSLEDYAVLCEIQNDNQNIVFESNKERPTFKALDNIGEWFFFQDDYYQLIQNKLHFQGKDYILYQYHKNTNTYKKITTDSITQIANRSEINKYLSKINQQIPYSTFGILDIDHFKNVNDTNGHLFGDQILAELGAILNIHKNDFSCLGRYGGEEFFFSIENKKIPEIIPTLENIKQSIEEYFVSGEKAITISMGITNYYHGDSAFEKVEEADQALYYVKNHGRNNIAYKNDAGEYILAIKHEEKRTL